MSTFVDISVASAKHAMVATPWTPSLSRSCTSIATRSAGTSMSWWSRCKPRWRPTAEELRALRAELAVMYSLLDRRLARLEPNGPGL